MIPWVELDTAAIPRHAGKLSLHQRGNEYSIRIDGDVLMNNLAHESEIALSDVGCEAVADEPHPNVLIGGLGMGYTLRAALDRLAPGAHVTISELVPAVTKWNRTYIGHLAGHPLLDSRVTVEERDVGEIIRGSREQYDVILLDVDNGPNGLTHPENDQLYGRPGLAATHKALKPGGVVAVWSAKPDRAFAERLRHEKFSVTVHRKKARLDRGSWHTVILARKK